MLRFDKMTVKAQEAVQEAQEMAARSRKPAIEPVHLLAALVAAGGRRGAAAARSSEFAPKLIAGNRARDRASAESAGIRHSSTWARR